MSSKSAEWYRRKYEDISGDLTFAAAAVSQTLKAARNSVHTIYIQRLSIFITTSAAQTLTIDDTANTPKVIGGPTDSSPTAATEYIYDFGHRGIPLTEGKDLHATFSAAGLAGSIVWEGYSKQTSASSAP